MRYFLVLLMLFTCAKYRSRDAGSDSGPVVFEGESKGFFLSPINEGDVELVSFTESNPIFQGTGSALIGGIVTDLANYPANFYTQMGNAWCSGTMIGDKVLSLAAHCVGDGKTATITKNGTKYSGICNHNPNYRNNATADWALCVVGSQVPGVIYEKILTDISKIKVGTVVELTGFGCTNPGGGSGNDGKFRIGKAPVIDIPSGSDHDVVTKGAVALCYGDSAGSAYYYEGNERYQFANNSRGNIRDTSYLSSFTSTFLTWAKTWSDSKGVKICGMDAAAAGCRTAEPPPQPSPCELAYNHLGQCLKGQCKTVETRELGEKNYATLFACLEESFRVD